MNKHAYRSIAVDSNNFPHMSKFKYSFNQKIHDLNLNSPLENRSMFAKIGRNGVTPDNNPIVSEKIKSGSNFSLEKINTSMLDCYQSIPNKNLKLRKLIKDNPNFKLPILKKR